MSTTVSLLDKLKQKKPSSSASKILETIETKKVDNKDELVFSFMFFDRTHKYFNLGGVSENWFIDLLDVLNDLSKTTWNEIYNHLKHTYDPHNYSGTTNADIKQQLFNEFGNQFKQLEQFDFCQLRLANKSNGRLHGFIIGNTYYIIWLDPHHNMYDSEHYEKAKGFKPMKSELEISKNNFIALEQEYKVIEELFFEKCGDFCPYIKPK